jgi:hypothetical protein
MSESQINDAGSDVESTSAVDKFGHLLRFPEEIQPVWIELTDEQKERRKVPPQSPSNSSVIAFYSMPFHSITSHRIASHHVAPRQITHPGAWLLAYWPQHFRAAGRHKPRAAMSS